MEKVGPPTETGCWPWIGAKIETGYGVFWRKRRQVFAHRFAYEALRGSIPPGLHIDHLCKHTSCVNPEHMELVTPRENVLRGNGPTAMMARRTHCIRGHEYTPENTVRYRCTGAARHCRQCRSERKALNPNVTLKVVR